MQVHPVALARGIAAFAVALAATAWAQSDPKQVDAHRKEDIAKHRTMAAAHQAAAQCLESGEKESVCHEALRKTCQGIAVGKYCGMRHAH